jgi:predicted dinucleotide-binding enzyme
MRIAIIGAGRVGTTLGAGWARTGHDVVYGVREPGGEPDRLNASAAVAGADVIVNALPFGAVETVFAGLGVGDAVLVDASNPLTPAAGDAERARPDSGAERLAAWTGSGRVVKAFNTTGSANMADPGYPAGTAAMFLAGDDDEAKGVVSALATELGFDAVDAGPLAGARDLEHLANIWIRMAYALGTGPGFAFAVLRR